MLKTVLTNAKEGKLTSKGVISQILAEEHCRIHAAGGDATAYYAKSSGKVKKKDNGKKCSHCKCKGHDVSECRTLKWEQEEKSSRSTSRSGTSSLGKGSNSKVPSKGLSKNSSKGSSGRTSTKVAAADTDSDDSDKTIQVFMAHAISDQPIERIFKTKAELRQSNLQYGWLINSSASRTMCSHQAWFSHFTPLSTHTKVILGDDSLILAMGTGHVPVHMLTQGKWVNSILQDVLYVPDLHGNLLSISHLAHHRAEVCFLSEDCHIYDKRKSLILEGRLHNDLYVMRMQVNGPMMAKLAIVDSDLRDVMEPPIHALTSWLTSSSGSLNLWHQRLGHLHPNAVTRMADDHLITGMDITDREPIASPCKPCLEDKQMRKVICKVTSTRAENVLGHVYTDVCRPLPVASHRGYRYFVTFIDDSSHFASISPIQAKSEVGKLLKVFITWAELETGYKVKTLRFDGGGEYMAQHVQDWLHKRGIKHEVTTADMPQHNGIAERLNRMLLDKSHAMLADAKLPKSYWLEALNYTMLLHKLSPSRSTTTTPSEAYTGTKPDVSRLHIFRCMAHVHVPKQSWDKLSARSLSCIFLGFFQQCSAFHLVH